MKKIAFVIPVFNRLKYTQECLEILEQEKSTSFFKKNDIKIVIANDGSTDGTEEWVNKNYPEVIVLQGTGDLWYAGSMNLGMRYAFNELESDFIMVWENDTYPIDNYFENLQQILEKWDGKTLICSKLFFKVQPNIIFGMGGTFNTHTGARSLIGRTQPDGPEFANDLEVDWFLGQGVLVHKSIVDVIGYFDDKNFPQYHADVDYSLRAKEGGFKNIVYPGLKLLNDTEATGISHIKNKSFKQFFESLTSIRSNLNFKKDIIFIRKHSNSARSYYELIKRYGIYTGSFLKWKTLSIFGIQKKNDELA